MWIICCLAIRLCDDGRMEVIPVGCAFLFRRNAKKALRLSNPKNWLLHFSKSGVVATELCANFLGAQFQDPTFLLMDSAAGHTTVTTLTRFRTVNAFSEVAIIPGGLT